MNFALVSKCKSASASSKCPERRSKQSAPRGAPSGYSQGGRGEAQCGPVRGGEQRTTPRAGKQVVFESNLQ